MPFESKAQAKFMFAKHPEMAKEMASKTPNMKKLPKKKKSSGKSYGKDQVMMAMNMMKK